MSDLVKCQLRMPSMEHLLDHIRYNAPHAKRMLTFGSRTGKTVTIYGAGPSLSDVHKVPRTDEYWACNSALPYLMDRKELRVTHGFCIDQGKEMLNPKEWERTFPVKYIVSSTINPLLTDHLRNRKTLWFHNYCGIKNTEGFESPVGDSEELHLYRTLYPTSLQVGHGLNAVPRAACLALAMGFKTIRIYGADCAARPNSPEMPMLETDEYREWMRSLVLYADGRNALECYGEKSPFAEAPDINGRRWHTRPDMVVSAQHLLQLQEAYPGRIELMGDTLPNALRGITEDLPTLNREGEVEGFGMKPKAA